MIADSHCHLDYSELYEQLDDVIERARLNKVEYLLTICTTLESFEKIKIIINKYKNIYGTFGIHPHEANKYSNINLEFILDLKKKFNKIIGIGETGLDYYYNHSDKKAQKESFIKHIHAAIKLDIPLIVHSRNAETDTFDIINSEKKNSNLKVLMHCFTGSKNFARKLIDINCYISVSGIITFKNSLDLQEAVSTIPIKNLLVETDSPYLAPMPHRGKTNEPSLIVHTIEKLAEIKKTSKENVISCTSNNFKNLFKII
tara:strand:- start:1043 stop:1816 length:774 start_codon:yes stop_codon:yes gene_type:complete